MEGICPEDKLPSVSSINRIVRSTKRFDSASSPLSSSSLNNYLENTENEFEDDDDGNLSRKIQLFFVSKKFNEDDSIKSSEKVDVSKNNKIDETDSEDSSIDQNSQYNEVIFILI